MQLHRLALAVALLALPSLALAQRNAPPSEHMPAAPPETRVPAVKTPPRSPELPPPPAPTEAPVPLSGDPTARCHDGSVTYSQHPEVACARHGGLRSPLTR